MARIKASEPDDRSERQRAARLVASIGILRIETREVTDPNLRMRHDGPAQRGRCWRIHRLPWPGIRGIRAIRGQKFFRLSFSFSLRVLRIFGAILHSRALVATRPPPNPRPRITRMARIKASKPDDRSERQRAARLVASIGILRIETREVADPNPPNAPRWTRAAGTMLAHSSAALVWYPRAPRHPRSKILPIQCLLLFFASCASWRR